MRKYIVICFIIMNMITIDAGSESPTYTIVAASNNQEDIDKAYQTKNQLLADYIDWSKGVDDLYQVCADHTNEYDASFYNGEYLIVQGDGNGKSIQGTLELNYCSSSQDVVKKSWFLSLFS